MKKIIIILCSLLAFFFGLSSQYFPTEPNLEILSLFFFVTYIGSFLILVSSVIIVILLIIFKKTRQIGLLKLFPFAAIGILIAYPVSGIFNEFQYNKLNKTGIVIENELDNFNSKTGHYPVSLVELSGLKSKLKWPYANLRIYNYKKIEDEKVINKFVLGITTANCIHDWFNGQHKWIAEDEDYR